MPWYSYSPGAGENPPKEHGSLELISPGSSVQLDEDRACELNASIPGIVDEHGNRLPCLVACDPPVPKKSGNRRSNR